MRITLNHGGWADTGCWIDGHWGQYGPDRLISIALAEGGWELADDDKLLAEIAHARLDEIGTAGTLTSELCEKYIALHPENFEHAIDAEGEVIAMLSEMADDAENHLNSICPEGYAFGWYDGEFFLWSTDEWEETP